MMVLGFNGRYANKKLNGGSFPSYAIGEYNMKVVDGSKYSYGFDLATQYKGFSSQFEYHYMVGQPQNINHSLLLYQYPHFPYIRSIFLIFVQF